MKSISGLRQLFYLAIGAQMLLSIGFAITAILGSNRYVFILCFDMGFFIGGHYFSHSLVNPQSLSSQSWGWLSFIWNPYRTWARSHSKMANLFAVGLTLRLLYFYACVQLALGLCYAILALPGIAIASLPDSATTGNFLKSFYMSSWRGNPELVGWCSLGMRVAIANPISQLHFSTTPSAGTPNKL